MALESVGHGLRMIPHLFILNASSAISLILWAFHGVLNVPRRKIVENCFKVGMDSEYLRKLRKKLSNTKGILKSLEKPEKIFFRNPLIFNKLFFIFLKVKIFLPIYS